MSGRAGTYRSSLTMDSDRVNKWLTLAANTGVLVGIVLILIELNQNSELMRAQLTQARADNVLATYREQMLSPEWLSIRAKRRAADSIEEWLDGLSPEEYESARYNALREFHSLRIQFEHHKAGLIDEEIWLYSTMNQARRLVPALPHFGFADDTDPEFAEFLNQIARESGLPPIHSDGL